MRWYVSLGLLLFLFVGCQTNIFDSLDSAASDPLSQVQEAQRALDTGDYAKAVDSADKVLTNTSASQSEKDNANAVKGEATLGTKGFTITSVASNLIEQISGGESSSTLYTTLKGALGNLSSADFDAANQSFDGLVTNGAASSNVSNDALLSAGVSEAAEAVMKVTETFDTDGDGKISAQEGQQNQAAWDSTLSNQVITATDNAVTLVTASFGTLSNDEKEVVNTIQSAQCQIKIVDRFCGTGADPTSATCSIPNGVTDCQSALDNVDG